MSETLQQAVSILAVEDDPGDFGLIRVHVRLSGLCINGRREPVAWAKTLAEGITTARSNQPDVVLLDLSLPDSTGLATVQAMRAALPGVPIVVLTGHDDHALAAAALQAGAQDYLVKGQFDHDALGRAVRHALVRNALERQLSESVQRLELALTGGDLGTWDWYVPSGDIAFNQRGCEMLGYALNEIEPVITSWQKMVNPEDWPVINAALEPHLMGETQMYEAEHRMRHKDGHCVWVLDRGKVVKRDGEGKPLRVAGTYLDITRQKQAEKILMDSRNCLKEQVGKMTSQLKELRDEFEDVNTTLKVLLNNRDKDKSAAQNALVREMSQEVAPFLLKLKKSVRDHKQARLLDVIENNLQQLASSYGNTNICTLLFWQLTPVEIQVASMIKQGLSTKDIATALSLSPETINVHRKHIRKKLGLSSKANNLRSHLTSLSG
ncbi:MAG: PAS domain-containing protein [Gallionella sp.]|nr:PAS domain-containing protein [Gallionella sp.]